MTTDVDLTWAERPDSQFALTSAGRTDVADLDLTADWLGSDRIRLDRAGLPAELSLVGDTLTIKSAMLACDVGTASAAGVVDLANPTAGLLDRPGQQLTANVDLAQLAELMPNLLRVRAGTELTAGRVAVSFATTPDPAGTTGWRGSLDATALTGTRDGHPLAWDQPLAVAFVGRTRADGLPEFEKLECHADFVEMVASGSPEAFTGRAAVNLDRLSSHLREFVDLDGVTLAGTADVTASLTRAADNAVTLDGSAKLTRFVIDDGRGHRIDEPSLDLTAKAAGRVPTLADGTTRIDTGVLTVSAGEDQFTVTVVEPIVDLTSPDAGAVSARLTGDLARWRGRVARFAPVPKTWTVSGSADLIASAEVRADRTFVVTGGGKLSQFAFADGRGGQVTDPALDLTLSATGRLAETDAGPIRVDTGNVVLVAGPDRAELTLLTPIVDVARLSSGHVSAKLTGDMGRWRTRAGVFAPVPADWTVDGTGTAAADVRFAPDVVRADNVAVDIKDVRFAGLGLNVDELEVITNCNVTADRNTGTVTISDMKLSSTSVSLATRSIEVTPVVDGGVTGKGTVAVVAKIDRVLRTAGVTIPDPALAPTGTATGTVGFALGRAGVLTFDVTGTVKDLVVGPPTDPTWAEPSVDFAAQGDWDSTAGNLRLASARGGRDGLSVDAKGIVTEMTLSAGLDLDGTITYDLAKLEPTLRKFIGQGTTVRGSGRRPFTVRGPLFAGADRLAVTVGGSPAVKGRRPFIPAARTPTPNR